MDQGGAQRRRRVHGTPTPNGRRSSFRDWAAKPDRPLTILGVERRGFLLVATVGLAMWDATASLVTGGVVLAVGSGAGWLAGRKDPEMLGVLRAGTPLPGPHRSGEVGPRALAFLIQSGR